MSVPVIILNEEQREEVARRLERLRELKKEVYELNQTQKGLERDFNEFLSGIAQEENETYREWRNRRSSDTLDDGFRYTPTISEDGRCLVITSRHSR